MSKIKAIFFDIGYTLCKPASGDWRITKKFMDIVSEDFFKLSSEEEIKLHLNWE